MALRLLERLRAVPALTQCSVGVAGALVFSAYTLPHSVFLSKLKNFAQAYKDGRPLSFNEGLRSHVDAVLNDAGVSEEDRSRLRFFTVFGTEAYHAGCLSMNHGAIIGLPKTFGLNSAHELDAHGFLVDGKKVQWDSAEGRQLERSLRLSPAAQRFAIARSLHAVQSFSIWIQGCVASTCLFGTYILGSMISHRTRLYQRPRTIRVMLYCLVSCFGGAMWVTSKDMLQNYYDEQNDQAAAKLGETYAWGGVEFYDKMLERNRALRALTRDGASLYTAYGNENTLIRTPSIPLTCRLEALKAFSESHYPRTQNDETRAT